MTDEARDRRRHALALLQEIATEVCAECDSTTCYLLPDEHPARWCEHEGLCPWRGTRWHWDQKVPVPPTRNARLIGAWARGATAPCGGSGAGSSTGSSPS